MSKLVKILAGACVIVAMPALAETFNNDSIIALTQAGVGDTVLLSKIDSLPCAYDVSTDKIIALRQAGVSNAVIAAMVNRCVGSSHAQGVADNAADPSVKRPPGIYIQVSGANGRELHVVRPTKVTGVHITGNGSLVFPFVAKLAVPQASAQARAESDHPEFYFYFEPADAKTGDFGTSASDAAQSPSEFSLVKFKLNSQQREMTIGKANAFNTNIGINQKNTLPFSVSEMGDGIFRVTMNNALAAGQYAFVLRAGSDAFRIYDFQVN